MYEINLSDEARTVIVDLPHDAAKALAEFLDVLAHEPDSGRLYRGPGSDLRTIAIADGQLLAVWLVLHGQQRVEILRLMWLGDAAVQRLDLPPLTDDMSEAGVYAAGRWPARPRRAAGRPAGRRPVGLTASGAPLCFCVNPTPTARPTVYGEAGE